MNRGLTEHILLVCSGHDRGHRQCVVRSVPPTISMPHLIFTGRVNKHAGMLIRYTRVLISASNLQDLYGNQDIFQSCGGRSGNFLKNPDTFAFTGWRKIPRIWPWQIVRICCCPSILEMTLQVTPMLTSEQSVKMIVFLARFARTMLQENKYVQLFCHGPLSFTIFHQFLLHHFYCSNRSSYFQNVKRRSRLLWKVFLITLFHQLLVMRWVVYAP